MKVLLVDDNPDVLFMATHLCKMLGHSVLTASNGFDALARLAAHHDTEAMVSDVVMPGMDGLELAEQASHQYPDLRVILTTGFPADILPNVPVRFPVLAKPYRFDDLDRALRGGG